VNSSVLDFKNVSVIRGGRKVLHNLSLTLGPAENVAILGPNGAGKSTLLKIMTRECYPVAVPGLSFRVMGEDVWNVFRLRERLGIVTQDLQRLADRPISGLDIVLSGFFASLVLSRRRILPYMKRQAFATLRFLGIERLKDRRMCDLSSGEARRFLIARALVHEPQALILDEPTNSLDLKAAHRFRELLSRISKKGKTLVLVTQTLEDIIPEIDRVILLKNGRILKDGPKSRILTQANLRNLFEVPLILGKRKGRYTAF